MKGETYEPVILDDGFGGRVERRPLKRGSAACAHCGAETEWIYRRTTSTAPPAEKPYCTILCCVRAIRHAHQTAPEGVR